ncbi:HAD-IIA family hydrolase [Ornithinimicrobium sediminis]|uniref:HAD-IIA family hydrolase n=1 Tax=Ornithinimicrobium sediminis TaxID=2904603 RepID=UPI001E58A1B4|nr:HAD-IIA family hydrolase [Ornithinimicrobium sediminis]MCE0488336.1 HAD-IIA family hydrolase [Ornithinimicrobium sediminis]
MTGRCEALIVDLDGVVYTGGERCPGAAEGLQDARAAGVALLFMTNNASRTPAQVAEHLGSVGVQAAGEEVLTSSQVGAAHLAQLRREEGLEDADPLVLAVGGPGVLDALRDEGFSAVTAAEAREAEGTDRPVWALLQGYGPQMMVRDLHEAAHAVNAGAHWVATNTDATLPTPRGPVPGNGALVAAVAHGTGATPVVVGKPHPPAYRIALQRLGLPADRVLAVGDRLDTDIDGALEAGVPAALVLTGVSTQEEADARPEERRPQHVAATLPDLAHLWR